MQLETRRIGDIPVIRVRATRIDASVALAFKESMRHEVDGEGGHVVLDLGEVQFIDSSGLGAIVAAMKAMGRNRKLALAGLMPTVAKVFRLTRMDLIFPIHDNPDDAVAELAGHAG